MKKILFLLLLPAVCMAQETSSVLKNRTTAWDVYPAQQTHWQLPPCMTCPDVKSVQQRLAALGHSPGPIDGVMGPRTRAAIRAYQTANNLPADGQMSDALLEALSPL